MAESAIFIKKNAKSFADRNAVRNASRPSRIGGLIAGMTHRFHRPFPVFLLAESAIPKWSASRWQARSTVAQ
jgi:hypothetical protein